MYKHRADLYIMAIVIKLGHVIFGRLHCHTVVQPANSEVSRLIIPVTTFKVPVT